MIHTEILPVALTEFELALVAKELGELEIHLAAVREAKKESSKHFNDRIDHLQEKIDEKALIATSGQEMRAVECRWVTDLSAGVKRLIRMDTDREVRSEILTEYDRQQSLFDSHKTKSDPESEVAEPSLSRAVSDALADVLAPPEDPTEPDAVADEDAAKEGAPFDAKFVNARNKNRRKRKAITEVETTEMDDYGIVNNIPF